LKIVLFAVIYCGILYLIAKGVLKLIMKEQQKREINKHYKIKNKEDHL